jgi:hypothetical protein
MIGVSKANVVNEEIYKGIKHFTHTYMDGRACLCLSACCSLITFDRMKGA